MQGKSMHMHSAPTQINSRQISQFELHFFLNEIGVELIQIAKNPILIDSGEIKRNKKK